MLLGLIIFSFLAAVLVLVPLPWQWRIKNYPLICLIIWLFIYNITTAANAILWSGTARLQHVAWCEIVTRIQTAINFAIPAALLCISVRLERVSSCRPQPSRTRLYTTFDIFMSLGFPAIMTALYYVFQTHRFIIVEDIGCQGSIINSTNGLAYQYIVPLVLSVLSSVFAGIAAIRFVRWRTLFAKHLSDNSHSMTLPAFVRLMLLSFALMSVCVVLFSLYIWVSVKETLSPNAGFKEIHEQFGVIPLIPKDIMTPFELKWTYGVLWAPPISTFLVFGLYSNNREVAKDYEPLFSWLSRCLPPRLCCGGDNGSSAQLMALGSNSFKSAVSNRDKEGTLVSTPSHTDDIENCVYIVVTKPLPVFVDEARGIHSPTHTEGSF